MYFWNWRWGHHEAFCVCMSFIDSSKIPNFYNSEIARCNDAISGVAIEEERDRKCLRGARESTIFSLIREHMLWLLQINPSKWAEIGIIMPFLCENRLSVLWWDWWIYMLIYDVMPYIQNFTTLLTFETAGRESTAAVAAYCSSNVHCYSSKTCLSLSMDTVRFAASFAFVVAADDLSTISLMRMRTTRNKHSCEIIRWLNKTRSVWYLLRE